jgi:tetratricopeptide (TPR) repeat protein
MNFDAQSLPDFNELWDYGNPAETERRFRELFPNAVKGVNTSYNLEVLTQIARAQGLQRKFEEAHATLDRVERSLAPDLRRARIRYLLERGRVFNSSKQPDKARPLFLAAWELGKEAEEDNFAIDAAHMMGIVEPPKESLNWNLIALKMAEATKDPRAAKWKGSLYNNIGWTFHNQKDYDKALDLFKKALAFRLEQGNENTVRIAKWCVARCLRSLGKVEEALRMQRELLKEHQSAGSKDGFVNEEIGECLVILGKADEARPHFGAAYAALSKDPWLAESDPQRIQRLKELGSAK